MNANALTSVQYPNVPPPPYVKDSPTLATPAEEAGKLGEMSTMGIGMGIGAMDSALNDYTNMNIENQVRTGTGPNGHAFDAMQHAQNQVASNNAHSAFRSSAMMLGSALGPEGLIGAGIVSAADYALQAVTQPSENTTNSTSGDLVNASTAN